MRLLDGIYVATVDKRYFTARRIFLLDTKKTMDFLARKRDAMINKKKKENKPIKRLNVTLSFPEAMRENLIIRNKS